MARRVCPEPGCPALIPAGTRYCPIHQAAYEARRGTAEQRGYDAAHRALRRQYAQRLAAGEVIPCARCGEPITAGDPWDLGHNDERTAWTGPEHANRCNRSAGGRRAHL